MRGTLATSSLILIFILHLTTTIYGEECKAIEDADWSFTGSTNGPYQWSKKYPMCGGKTQSPISLFSDDVESPDQDPLKIVGYDIPLTKAEFFNDGVKVIVYPKDEESRYVEMEGSQYKFTEFHLHWSEKLNGGTVHAIDYKTYAMEVHFVHQSDEGIKAGLAVLYEATSEPIDAFEPVVNNLPEIQYKNNTSTYQGEINLMDFLPSDRAYFNYEGSHTTPPCAEGVNWSVFQSIQKVGKDQVKEFPKLYAVTEDEAEPGCRITTNIRPLQEDNDRSVYLYENTRVNQ